VVEIDLDCDEGVALASLFLPATATFGWLGSLARTGSASAAA